jgi:uncharacterized protein YlxP (DUF503 family)
LPERGRDQGKGFVGVIRAELVFGENGSLKGKRMYLRRMRDHLTRRGASFAEVGYQDLWQRARVLVALAASDAGALECSMSAAARYLDSQEWEVVALEQEVIELDE